MGHEDSIVIEPRPIVKTPGVCGGDACFRGTRVTVWGLVESRRAGASDAGLLVAHPGLTAHDLAAAWDYARDHAAEIERSLWENEACMVEHDGVAVPADLIRRGECLGLTDDEIRAAFEPPLDGAALARSRRAPHVVGA